MAACGQKGPPLAPIVYLPRPVSDVVVKRIEDDVIVQFTVPTLNTDNSGPADLRKVDVYAHTGPLPAPADFLKYGTLVASVPIKQPPTKQELAAAERAKAKQAEEQKAQGEEEGAESKEGAEGKEPSAPAPSAGAANAKSAGPSAEARSAKEELVEQGWTTSVRETLTAKEKEIGPMPPPRPIVAPETAVVVERTETPGTVNFDLAPQRYYVIVGFSDSRNRPGPFAGPIQVALLDPLSPPEKVAVDYTADAVSLTWPGHPEDIVKAAPANLPVVKPADASTATQPVKAPDVPAEPQNAKLEPVDRETDGTVELYADVETEVTQDVLVALAADKIPSGAKPKPRPQIAAPPPAPRFGYNVYETSAMGATGATTLPASPATAAPDAAAPVAPIAPGAPAAPKGPIAPLNATLLTSPGFTDPRVEFGVERCYIVRRVEMAGPIAIESAPSAPACVAPVDTFPPAAPKSLAHIASANGVSLLWEANTEPDLGGYVVLRGEAPGDKLSPLTPAPIADTSFVDTTVRRGRTYVYEVIAVDRSTPPNRSAASNRVEETIR